ncbi:MAG: glycosyltransferase family 4 protein [Patescibacteria group bacterium]
MKICILTQTFNSQTGAGVFASNLMNGVKKQNPNMAFSVMTGEDFLKPNIYQLLKNWLHIRNEIKKSDLVHALDAYPYGVIACMANLGVSKPVIITAVGSGSIGKLGNFGWKPQLLRWAYGRATHITAISHYVAQEIKKVLPNLLIEVINPGVDYSFYAGKSDNDGLNISAGFEYIITQGEFKRRKGYTEILPIMKKVMSAHPEVRYVIVANAGKNQSYQKELYELMDELGIRDRVIIKSNLSREALREAYSNARLYLTLPINVRGDVEGFGMAIMEASATGTPAVVGKGSGANDAVRDGGSGFLVDGGNEEQVVEKILSIIDDENLRAKLSNGAKKWASENSWESKVKQYISLYEKI